MSSMTHRGASRTQEVATNPAGAWEVGREKVGVSLEENGDVEENLVMFSLAVSFMSMADYCFSPTPF